MTARCHGQSRWGARCGPQNKHKAGAESVGGKSQPAGLGLQVERGDQGERIFPRRGSNLCPSDPTVTSGHRMSPAAVASRGGKRWGAGMGMPGMGELNERLREQVSPAAGSHRVRNRHVTPGTAANLKCSAFL